MHKKKKLTLTDAVPSTAADGVSSLLLLLLLELFVLLFLNPLVIMLSTGDIPVTMGRWLGVVADDLAIGGDTKKGLINFITKFWKTGGNLHRFMFPTSVLYKAPENNPHSAGIIVLNDWDTASYNQFNQH